MQIHDTFFFPTESRWKRVLGWSVLLFIATCFAIILVWLVFSTAASAEAGPGDSGQEVVEVQYMLRSYGYVIPVDGVYGPKTTRAVKHFQKSNKLLSDGIVGPITMETLVGAKRINPPVYNPPVNHDGLRGLSFAPEGLAGCEEMSYYRQQAGLPEQFDAIGYRESRCQNTAENSCCHGWWQAHEGNWRGTSYAIFFREHCQAQSADEVDNNDARSKQKSACVTKVMYDISGMTPWRL